MIELLRPRGLLMPFGSFFDDPPCMSPRWAERRALERVIVCILQVRHQLAQYNVMNDQEPKKTIFLSHASEDRDLAKALQNAIEEAFPEAFNIFNAFEANSIAPSDDWLAKLRSAIHDSSYVLVLLTRNSLDRPWIYWETGVADHRGIRIIPLLGPGCEITTLPDPFRAIQGVSILDKRGIQRLMNELAKLPGMTLPSTSYDPSAVVKKLQEAEINYSGKQWSEMADSALRRFLSNPDGDPVLVIRAMSYTSETTAKTLQQHISKGPVTTPLRIKVLLRSEYDRFASRPTDTKFNQRIRWKISRAKADWYRWFRTLGEQTHSIKLEIRDYWWDPAPRILLLGRREGFFGLYEMNFQKLSGHFQTEIPKAWDWTAADTCMARIGSSNQEQLDNFVAWFDHAWERGRERTNEAYRCKGSDTLLELCEKKATTDPAIRDITNRWRLSREEEPVEWQIGNLALPASYPEETGEIVEFMSCSVILADADDAILVCEIRRPGETWEGIGKTYTYLDLLGIRPEARHQNGTRKYDSLSQLHQDIQAGADICWNMERREKRVSLFASDFVWLYQQQGKMRIVRPEGEVLWGLWDCSRHLLRISMSDHAWARNEGAQRSQDGRPIIYKLFVKLPVRDLDQCYVLKTEANVRAVVILDPDAKEKPLKKVKNLHKAKNLLVKAIQSAPHHPSDFWRREPHEVEQHNSLASSIVSTLDVDQLPPVYIIRRPVPFGSVGDLIRKEIFPH